MSELVTNEWATRNPHDPRTNRSLAILRVNQHVPEDVIREISTEIRAHAAFSIKL